MRKKAKYSYEIENNTLNDDELETRHAGYGMHLKKKKKRVQKADKIAIGRMNYSNDAVPSFTTLSYFHLPSHMHGQTHKLILNGECMQII